MAAYLKRGQHYGDFLRFFLFFLPFLAMSVISYTYTWNRFATLTSLNALVWALGCTYVYLLAENKNSLLKALVTGGFLVALCAIVQHRFLFPGLLDAFKEGAYAQVVREQSGIPFVSYLYHNMVGGYLAFIFPLALYFSVYEPPARSGVSDSRCNESTTGRILQAARPFLFMLFAAVIITGIILSSSRIGMGLALLCLIFVAIALLVRKAWRGLLKMACLCLLAAIIAFAVFHQGPSATTPEVDVRATLDAKMKTAYSQMSTLNTRTDIWQNGLRAFKEHPLLGYGAGCFEYGYRKYFDGGTYTGVAHNTLLKHGVELGIIGLACFLLYCAGIAARIKWFWPDMEYRFVLLSTTVGFLYGMVDFSFDVPSHCITFFILSSLLFQSVSPAAQTSTVGVLPVPARVKFKSFAIFITVLIPLMLALAFTARANQFRKAIEIGTFFEENGQLQDALTVYEEALIQMPYSGEGYTRTVNVLTKLYAKEHEQSSGASRARELESYIGKMEKIRDRDSGLFFALGRAYATRGDRMQAGEYFQKTLQYYPSSAYYISEIAGYYFIQGDIQRAEELIRSFDPYIEKYNTPHNPRGLMVYKIRDLESSIAYRLGYVDKALAIARRNYEDARSDVFVIKSARSREYVTKDALLQYLAQRVKFFESQENSGKRDAQK
jgi:O-antigen ligase